ncbi:MAG: hypothetical protein VXZ71_00545, partial [SAR324 cluster bacterium]|nr:hypothetical protein [SAR324 cluster bacterium]
MGFCGILITANPGVEGLNLWVLLILIPAVGMSLQNTMMTRYTGLGKVLGNGLRSMSWGSWCRLACSGSLWNGLLLTWKVPGFT